MSTPFKVLFVHGLLHLLGHDHEGEEAEARAKLMMDAETRTITTK